MSHHHLPLLTTSATKVFRACPRRYRYEYVDGYRSALTPETLAFGTLGHRGLEAWWIAARDYPDDSACWLEAAVAALAQEQDPFRSARAHALIIGYHYRWIDADGAHLHKGHRVEVLAVEAEFRAPLVNPATGGESRTFQRAGKIDALVRVAGQCYTVEHKTSAEDITPGSEYWQRLTLDAQVSNYHVGARALGYQPVGCIYDVLGKPALRPLKATPPEARKYVQKTGALYANQRADDETPAEYHTRLLNYIADHPDTSYARGEVVRLEQDEQDAAFDQWQTAASIRESTNAARWPRNPDACQRYGHTCAFFPVCTGIASLDDPTRYRRSERVHEELTAPPGVMSKEVTFQ